MAIDPGTLLGAQVDTSTDPTGYPYGQARDIAVTGDGTGTPLRKEWLSDIWGLFQSLLSDAGIVPSGTPDKVGASQYLQALNALFIRQDTKAPAASYRVLAQTVTYTEPLIIDQNLNPEFQYGLTGGGGGADTIQVPKAGLYRAEWALAVRSTSTSDGIIKTAKLMKGGVIETGGGTVVRRAAAPRYGTSTTSYAFITGSAIFSVTTPASEKIQLEIHDDGAGDTATIVDYGSDSKYNFLELEYLGPA